MLDVPGNGLAIHVPGSDGMLCTQSHPILSLLGVGLPAFRLHHRLTKLHAHTCTQLHPHSNPNPAQPLWCNFTVANVDSESDEEGTDDGHADGDARTGEEAFANNDDGFDMAAAKLDLITRIGTQFDSFEQVKQGSSVLGLQQQGRGVGAGWRLLVLSDASMIQFGLFRRH